MNNPVEFLTQQTGLLETIAALPSKALATQTKDLCLLGIENAFPEKGHLQTNETYRDSDLMHCNT